MREEGRAGRSVGSFYRRAWGDFRRALPELLLYDILFKVLAFALLSPLLSALYGFFLSRSGSHAIGNSDIARFLLSPAGLAALAVAIPVGTSVIFLEFAGLLLIGFGAAAGRNVTWRDAMVLSFRKAPGIVRLSFFWLLLAAALLIPFAAAGGLAYLSLLSAHDINYYLTVQPPEYRTALAIGVILLAAAALVQIFIFVALAFALPLLLVRDLSPRKALATSVGLVRRNLRVTGSVLAGFLLLWSAVSAAVNSFVEMTGKALVGVAGEKMSLLVLVLGGVVAFNFLVAAILSFAVAAFSCLLIVRLYLDLQGEEAVPDGFFDGRKGSPEAGTRRVLSRKVVLGAAVAALAIAVVASLGLLESLSLEDRVTITAHRGSSLTAPENTLSAVEQAIADGADIVEFDVQESADGIVVVAHDADLMRVAGEPLVVTGSTFEELRKVDVGKRFDPKFAGESIPTLDEVIETARGRVGLIVEIKTYAGDYRSLVGKVVRTLGEKHVKDSAVIMSLEFREVQEVRRLDPGVTVGFTPAVSLGDLTRLDCDFLAVSASMARDSLIGAAHAAGKEVYVWTVNEPADISLMIDRGVDSIITDDPAAAARVLAERAELSNAERLLLRFKALYVD